MTQLRSENESVGMIDLWYGKTILQGTKALVDPGDLEFLSAWKWSALLNAGMAVRTRLRVRGQDQVVYLHQMVALRALLGVSKEELDEAEPEWIKHQLAMLGRITHANELKIDNRRGNLRYRGGLPLVPTEQSESENETMEEHEEPGVENLLAKLGVSDGTTEAETSECDSGPSQGTGEERGSPVC